MREIKFRAWLPKTKEMLYHGSKMDLWGYGWLVNGGLVNAIPMQYTGLKDKNGKEIYEGDILKGEINEYLIGCFIVRWVNDKWVANREQPSVDDERLLYSVSNSFEVIGNICENPEFLKV